MYDKSIAAITISNELLEDLLKINPRYSIIKVYQRPADYNTFEIIVEDSQKELYQVIEGGDVPHALVECEMIRTHIKKG